MRIISTITKTKPWRLNISSSSATVLIIFLVGFMCLLSGLDAPEYIRCTHIGICEFLEVCGELSNVEKTVGMVENMNKFLYQILSVKNRYGQPPYFFPRPKTISPSMDLAVDFVQAFDLPGRLGMLYRCVHPYNKVLCSPLDLGSEILVNKEQITPSEGDLPSQILQIITTSIIKS